MASRLRFTRHPRRTLTAWFAVAALVSSLLSALAVTVASPASAAPPRTAVTFTFDDATASQYAAFQKLASRGMVGTVYANSAFVGASGYMTLAQLQQVKAWGHEIGSHTATHQNFLTLPDDEVSRQVCLDRQTLTGWGFQVTSFAYPFADFTAAHEAIVKNCGFNSGRQVGDLKSPSSCLDCDVVETRPPADPYAVRTVDEVVPTMTLTQMKKVVTDAERTGGWITFVFHKFCAPACSSDSMDPAVFNQFVDWLYLRQLIGTKLQTMHQVVGGTVKPLVPGAAPNPPGATGVNVVKNPSLETLNPYGTGNPDCWSPAGYGTNTPTYARVSPGHTGSYAEQVSLTSRTDGDAKIVQTFDLGHCVTQVVTGHQYTVSMWYKSTAQTFITMYQRNAIGQWSYWTQSPRFAPASDWTQVTWVTPAVPAGMTAASYGLTLDSVGTLTTDDYSFAEGANNTPAPPGQNALKNANLNVNGAYGFPECWTGTGYGTNTVSWSTATNPGDGSPAVKLTMSSRTDGDAKLVPIMDNGTCSPYVTVDHPYTMSAQYSSTQPVFWTIYKRDAAGAWSYWTQSPAFPATGGTWSTAAFTTANVPAGTTALSIGLTLDSVGELTTDNYSLVDSFGQAPAALPNAIAASPTPSATPTVTPTATPTATATPTDTPPAAQAPAQAPAEAPASVTPSETSPSPTA